MPNYPTFTKPKIISYPEAPSGKIVITKYIEPFVPVKGGHGFIGVVAEDVESGKLQCHVCGVFLEMLCSHYSVKHGMDGKEYRAKFGLLESTALKTVRIRTEQSKRVSKMQKDGRMNIGNRKNINGKSYGFQKGNSFAGNRLGKPKAVEHQNKFGVCDEQIKTAILKLAEKLGKTPTLNDLRDEYSQAFLSVLHLRYKSYIGYCKYIIKMKPNHSAHNPYTKKESYDLYINRAVEEHKKGTSIDNITKLCPSLSGITMKKLYKNSDGFRRAVKRHIGQT